MGEEVRMTKMCGQDSVDDCSVGVKGLTRQPWVIQTLLDPPFPTPLSREIEGQGWNEFHFPVVNLKLSLSPG